MVLVVLGVIVLAEPMMLIIGGAVFAVLLDGGTRLLGRYLPIARAWRLLLVILLGFGFIGWVVWFAGTTIAEQFESLREVVSAAVRAPGEDDRGPGPGPAGPARPTSPAR